MIVVISGRTGAGVESFARLVAAACNGGAVRGDSLGHWRFKAEFDQWVYSDEALCFSLSLWSDWLNDPDRVLVVPITDGADRNVFKRICDANWALLKSADHKLVIVRYLTDDVRLMIDRSHRFRSDHSLRNNGLWVKTQQMALRLYGPEYFQVEDVAASIASSILPDAVRKSTFFCKCSRPFSELLGLCRWIWRLHSGQRSGEHGLTCFPSGILHLLWKAQDEVVLKPCGPASSALAFLDSHSSSPERLRWAADLATSRVRDRDLSPYCANLIAQIVGWAVHCISGPSLPNPTALQTPVKLRIPRMSEVGGDV